MGAVVNLYPAPTGRQLIDSSAITAASTYTSPSWTAGQFREVSFNLYLSTTDGATQPFLTFTGLAGVYKTQITYSSNVTPGSLADATHWNMGILTSGELSAKCLLTSGQKRSFLGQAFSGTTAFTISAENSDTSGPPTAMVITFASASTGRIELWGWA